MEDTDEIDQDDTVRDRDWINRQQDDRLPWSKKTNSIVNNYSSTYQRTSGTNSYRNIRQPIPLQRPTRGQFYQTQFIKPEPARKATIPFLQPAFAPNASTQYPRDQPLPRLKPGTVRTRGKYIAVYYPVCGPKGRRLFDRELGVHVFLDRTRTRI